MPATIVGAAGLKYGQGRGALHLRGFALSCGAAAARRPQRIGVELRK